MMEETYMVCVRVADLDDPVEGSTTTACVECGVDIWISAESRKKMYAEGAMPLCEPCAKRMQRDLTEVDIGQLSDGQMEEIAERLRKVALERGEEDWLKVLDNDELDAFEALKATASMAAEEMQHPGDDWGSMLTMIDYSDTIYPPFPLGKAIKNGLPRELMVKQLLPAMIQASQAKRVLLGLCPHGDGALEVDNTIGDVLILVDITADGAQQMAMAPITRSETEKPELGDWLNVPLDYVEAGLFVDVIVSTLQFVRTLHDS